MQPEQVKALSPAFLAGFTGSGRLFQHPMGPRIVMTEGALHVTRNGAAWFVDIIASTQPVPGVYGEPFQHWVLRKDPDGSAVVTCDDGNDNVVYRRAVPFTDYPHEELRMYLTEQPKEGVGLLRVVMLPSEY